MSRILVIDDDRSVRHLITKAFEDSDVEVLPAATVSASNRRPSASVGGRAMSSLSRVK